MSSMDAADDEDWDGADDIYLPAVDEVTFGGNTVTIEKRAPGKSRRKVLFNSSRATAAMLKAEPGNKDDKLSGWHVIAGGDRQRKGTYAQTRIRIEEGQIADFARVTGDEIDEDPESPSYGQPLNLQPGHFEATVRSDRSVKDRVYPVELFARWVPD